MSVEKHETVMQALAAGKFTVPDTATGYHRSMYATCPHDGESVPIRRVVRGSGGAITEVTMRCSRCGSEFTPPLSSLYLQ